MSTIDYYNKNAKSYFDKTVDAKMAEQYNIFLKHVKPNGRILDFGCGSGRDSLAFKNMGFEVYAIDGSEELCKLARQYTGLDVKCMDFFDLNDKEFYDGIWACSSILHVEREKLPDILRKMIKALKEDGVIYTCFKIGNKEIVQDGKYYNYITKELLENMLRQIDPNSQVVDYYENGTCKNVDRPTASWGNYLIKKKRKV